MSPYAQRGELHEAHRKHYGVNGDPVLVWQADTRRMNPSVPQEWIDSAFERDPIGSAAEYGAQFRSDVASFISRAIVESCVVSGRRELAPQASRTYVGFVDPSGGSVDSMTLAIAHREGDQVILDCLRERIPPFNPSDVVREFVECLDRYGGREVSGVGTARNGFQNRSSGRASTTCIPTRARPTCFRNCCRR
jgi:hypothetical protein